MSARYRAAPTHRPAVGVRPGWVCHELRRGLLPYPDDLPDDGLDLAATAALVRAR
ncbi:hypothetical protein [Streptomyces lavendulae]|uniref:hypothetical protein n=1 Tax=Streptomyces lavendulae TaxID=1914 RepID=UPI0036E3AE39